MYLEAFPRDMNPVCQFVSTDSIVQLFIRPLRLYLSVVANEVGISRCVYRLPY